MIRSLRLCLVLAACAACSRDVVYGARSVAGAPAEISFGSLAVGARKTLPLTITNQASYDFELSGATVGAPFSVGQSSLTIPSGGSASVDVVFAPQTGASFDQTLTIDLTATETPTLQIRLTGTGVMGVPGGGDGGTTSDGGTASDGGTSDGGTANDGGTPDGGGTCGASSCGANQACCGDACVDTQSDPAHCGGCAPCLAGQSCNAGVCSGAPPPSSGCDDLTAPCPGAQKCCNHACVDVGPGGLCPCSGPGNTTTFGAGTIIIPMDACYQRGLDVTTLPSYCNAANSKSVGDDAPLKAYGLVFFLLRHQVTVYMAIDPNKTAIDAVDLQLASLILRRTGVDRYDWASGTVVPLADTTVPVVSYRGGPFLIDSSQHDRVLQLLAHDPDFAQFRSAANITVHVANKSFPTAVAKAITAVPSRVALLQVPATRGDSPTDILVRYLTSAGLNFPGAGGTPSAPGVIYDVLQESDFLPDYQHSNLKAGGYKLLWSPHWEGGTSNTPAQLDSIGAFVSAGNDLFAECAAIGTLEGFSGGGSFNPPGRGATQFMTGGGMNGDYLNIGRSGGYAGPFAFGGLASPFAQRGDFPFLGFTGLITDFTPNGNYYSNVVRYITSTDTDTDLFTSVDLHSSGKGTVVYLAGHDYSYNRPNGNQTGITAGSRLVLNTLFSLGTNNTCQ